VKKDVYLWGILIIIVIYFIQQQEWAKLAVYLPLVFFVLAIFFLFVMPTRCRFPGRNGPCRNRSFGVIFGCKRYHWWMKASARLGIDQQKIPPSPARGYRRGTAGVGFDAISVRVEETGKDRFSRRLGVLSACIGLITAIPTIATWVTSLFR
jgi:hypothetical protein